MSRTPEQVIWDFVNEWMLKAEGDLRAAEHLLALKQQDYFTAAFHAQQAAEKLVKALLVRHQIPFGKTHDINGLLELAARQDASLKLRLASAVTLTPFGVEFRYPGDQAVDFKTAEAAVHEARCVRAVVLEHLQDYLSRGRPTLRDTE